MLANQHICKPPYEVVFSDGTFVIVTLLDKVKIANAYLRKYGILPDKPITDYYNVLCYYHNLKD